MDFDAFRSYLRKKGKQPHVVEDLCARVAAVERLLIASGLAPETAHAAEVLRCSSHLDNNDLRGLAFLHASQGRDGLAHEFSEARRERIARASGSTAVRAFLGVDADHIARLAEAGVTTGQQMVERGRSPACRVALVAATGVPLAAIEECTKLADLSRLAGVKAKRARLYLDAGFATLDAIAAVTPEALCRIVADHIAQSGFDGVAVLPKEASSTIAAARKLPRLVDWG